MITLSKSEYMMFLKHPAWLWLKRHDKKKLPEPDANLQAMFDAGNLFEKYAEELFSDIVRVGFENYNEYLSMPDRTKKALADGAKVLTQGRFEADIDRYSITCIVDVIELVEENTFDLYEIKSSTKVKPDHIEDLAFQVIVLEGAGYKVRNISVIYCNNSYVRHGEIDAKQMTCKEDVTIQVKSKLESTRRNIVAAINTIGLESMPDPTPRRVKLGGYKEWIDILLSIKPTDDKYSIYSLAQVTPEQIGNLEDMHISSIVDIPDTFELKPVQKRQIEATRLGEPLVDTGKIAKFIDKLEYPIYFLDYETLSSIVPPFDGLKPYQQLPFQYSLHILKSLDADLEHREFLHTLDTNPVPELLAQLQSDIGDKGSVLVWYEGFEKTCNNLMAELQPDYAVFLAQVNDRVLDLMLPFKNGHYVDKDFMGSASIKNVLPVLAPELSYKDMDISEGATAQRLWMEAVYTDKNSEAEKAKLMESLRQYCELDTYAMVRIFEFLIALTRGEVLQGNAIGLPASNKSFEQQSLF
ncbi:MAG TPA: DUF2779 domain-containing protein [Candidatus Saccharibacteria bacterium]|nr:DUF2779 domain-containing protein [Candidatus Saccharibacteria bacterium]